MTTTSYRLPEVLGGGECEIAEQHVPTSAWPNHVVVKVPDERVGAWYVLVPKDALTEVLPEPPVGSFVYTGSAVLHRRDDTGIDWFSYANGSWLTWAQVCGLDPPVRLVPAPEPVELPWASQPYKVGIMRTTVHANSDGVVDENSNGHTGVAVVMPPEQAREKARALNTAADQAEREVSDVD